MNAASKFKDTCSLEEKLMTNLDTMLKSREITFQTKVRIVKSKFFFFPVVMYGYESGIHKESWVLKNWFWTVVLEKSLESPLDCKIKPVNPKGKQHWMFIGRTDTEAKALMLWPLDTKSQLLEKDPDSGTDWRQEEYRMTDDEMIEWHHWVNGHEFEQTLGDSEGQGSLVCWSSWCYKESDATKQLNSNCKTCL